MDSNFTNEDMMSHVLFMLRFNMNEMVKSTDRNDSNYGKDLPRDPVKFLLTKQCPNATGMERHKCWRDECDGPCKLEGLLIPIKVDGLDTTAFHRDCEVDVDFSDPVKFGEYKQIVEKKSKIKVDNDKWFLLINTSVIFNT